MRSQLHRFDLFYYIRWGLRCLTLYRRVLVLRPKDLLPRDQGLVLSL